MRKLVTTVVSSAGIFALSCLAPALSQAAPCDGAGSEQPFLNWHDQASYVLVSGGDFESAAADWALDGGAAVVLGGAPFRDSSSANSLGLPAGADATTPPICVGKGDPVARIFMRTASASTKHGNATGLRVEVLYLNGQGDVRKTKKAGSLHGSDEWAPSRRFSLAQGQFSHGAKPPPTTPPTTDPYGEPPHGHGGDNGHGDAPHGSTGQGHGAPHAGGSGSIELRFTAGNGSDWQIDDVFVDPRARY